MGKEVYVGVSGHVVAYDKYTGAELWRTRLKAANSVSICVDDDVIVANAGGHLFGLDKSSGEIKWKNEMSGLGFQPASIFTVGPCGIEEIVQRIVQPGKASDADGDGRDSMAAIRDSGCAGNEDALQTKADVAVNAECDIEQAPGDRHPVAGSESADEPSELIGESDGQGGVNVFAPQAAPPVDVNLADLILIA